MNGEKVNNRKDGMSKETAEMQKRVEKRLEAEENKSTGDERERVRFIKYHTETSVDGIIGTYEISDHEYNKHENLDRMITQTGLGQIEKTTFFQICKTRLKKVKLHTALLNCTK